MKSLLRIAPRPILMALVPLTGLFLQSGMAASPHGSAVEGAHTRLDASLVYQSFEYAIQDGEVTITGFLRDVAEAVIPESIGGLPVTVIGKQAFENSAGLTRVVIPESVRSLERLAFMNCISLTKVVMG